MMYETALGARDSVRLQCLNFVTGRQLRLTFSCGSGERLDYVAKLRQEGSRVCVYEGFNLTEDPSGEVLTLRPVTARESLRIFFAALQGNENSGEQWGTVGVYRKETKAVERAFDITPQLRSAELAPRKEGGFVLRLRYEEPQEQKSGATESAADIAQLEEDNQSKETRRQEAQQYLDKLRRIEAAYDKDYAAMQEEIAACRERLGADSKVLQYYRDRDFVSAEQLQSEIAGKLDELEQQIRLFIEEKQARSLQIENQIKSGGSGQGVMPS